MTIIKHPRRPRKIKVRSFTWRSWYSLSKLNSKTAFTIIVQNFKIRTSEIEFSLNKLPRADGCDGHDVIINGKGVAWSGRGDVCCTRAVTLLVRGVAWSWRPQMAEAEWTWTARWCGGGGWVARASSARREERLECERLRRRRVWRTPASGVRPSGQPLPHNRSP